MLPSCAATIERAEVKTNTAQPPSNEVAFLPGSYPSHSGPLQRYLPPLPDGVAGEWLADRAPPGAWILDPFGASPRLTVELARAGYAVLAAVNNPISRFLIELYAAPPGEAELRATLADLAATHKSGERIEQQIRPLYITECANCGNPVEAQAFIWEVDGKAPVGRIYQCPICKDSGERPATAEDVQRAIESAASPLYRARALERVAPLADPDRSYAEEALGVYPPRAVYTLFNLINHLDQLPPQRRRLAHALLLAAFDQSNGLWRHPAVRFRPRQLTLPQRYLEKNVWLSIENAVNDWSEAFSEARPGGGDISVSAWPDTPDGLSQKHTAGFICIYEGRLKDLAEEIQSAPERAIHISAVVGALPRPNQAFWTLSALWSGWLWGHAASGPFKAVLRRRRYDWSWHVEALTSAFSSLATLIEKKTPFLGLTGEAEAGLLSAVLVAGELAGLDIGGVALRSEQEQAQITWLRGEQTRPAVDEEKRRNLLRDQMVEFLHRLAEPASYLKMHAACLVGLAQAHAFPALANAPPAEILRQTEDSIQAVLTHGSPFVQVGTSSRAFEAGQWQLEENYAKPDLPGLTLADRVEMAVIRLLVAQTGVNLHEVDRAICQELRGLFTPDLQLIQACLSSYGVQNPPESGIWTLRSQDTPAARRSDLAEMQNLLLDLGNRLGFRSVPADAIAKHEAIPATVIARNEAIPALLWLNPDGSAQFIFFIIASAVLGKIPLAHPDRSHSITASTRLMIVLPGGRSSLIETKLRRDARLRALIADHEHPSENKWKFLKYRHMRWLAENENLSQAQLEKSLDLDPLANRDPQMPLL